jgi:hypothetical protein
MAFVTVPAPIVFGGLPKFIDDGDPAIVGGVFEGDAGLLAGLEG